MILRLLSSDQQPLPLLERIQLHNQVVHRIRAFLVHEGYVEIPVPELTPATGSCEVVDSMFSLDYFGGLAFPRQTGQLFLEDMVARGLDAVYCEGESLRREFKVDARHLTEFKLIEIEKKDMTLTELCDFQEKLLKDIITVIHADLAGGANVTRLDRTLRLEHPRMTYREAITILNRRGFSLSFGDDLDREAEASLCRYAGHLPVHVTHFPESLKFFNMKLDRTDPTIVECVDYILPFSGETFGGSVREPEYDILKQRLYGGTMYGHLMKRAREFATTRYDTNGMDQAATPPSLGGEEQPSPEREELAAQYQRGIENSFLSYLDLFKDQTIERAGFGLGVARLLQFVMGLDSIKDAVAFPMDRTRFGGLSQTAHVGG
jgi:asparaginyl-tRNA synthetase